MTSGDQGQFDSVTEHMALSGETVALDLRSQILLTVNENIEKVMAYNSTLLDLLGAEQLVKFNEPEVWLPTARAWYVPTAPQYIQHNIPSLFIYSPYGVDGYRKYDGTYGVCFLGISTPKGGSALVALTDKQTVLFAEGEELILEETEEGVLISGVKVDSESTDTDIDLDAGKEIAFLKAIKDCLATYKPTSQHVLNIDQGGGSHAA